MQRQTFLALALAAGLMASPAAAQTDRPGAPAPGLADSGRRMMDPIGRLLEQREQLELTDDQTRRLEEIRSRYQEQHQAQMERLRHDRQERASFRASLDSARAEVAAVLTPEQQKQVEAMREEWRKKWREEHRGRHGHGHDKHRDHEDSKDG